MHTASRFSPFLTPANMLSLSRVPLGGVFWFTLHGEGKTHWAPLLVLAIAGITDIFDGKVARRTNGNGLVPSPANPGTWLDPVCDKIFVALILAALWVERSPPIVMLVMILSRELAQLPMALAYRIIRLTREDFCFDFSATIFGKITTGLQFAAVISLLLDLRASFPLALASCVIGLLAAAGYLQRALSALRRSRSAERV